MTTTTSVVFPVAAETKTDVVNEQRYMLVGVFAPSREVSWSFCAVPRGQSPSMYLHVVHSCGRKRRMNT